MPQPLLARGEIDFEPGAPGFERAVVHAYLEDATEADAPARVVAEQHTAVGPRSAGSPATIPFALNGPPLDGSRAHYVRVHVDVSGTGSVRKGDFVSTQSYSVRPSQLPVELRIRVRWVRP